MAQIIFSKMSFNIALHPLPLNMQWVISVSTNLLLLPQLMVTGVRPVIPTITVVVETSIWVDKVGVM
jgi:hypothetical protein